MGTRLAFVDTLGWMGAYNSAHPRPIPAREFKLCPTPGTVGGPGSQPGNSRCFVTLAGSEHSAVFLTEFHEGERLLKAVIKLIPAPQEMASSNSRGGRLAAELSILT